MKKALFFTGLAAASLLFAGCNKEADVKDLGGYPINIVLNTPQTRTLNDEMSTKWEQDDQLTVFYAPAGSTDYSTNKQFVVSDPDNNRATGEVTLEASSNDWYLFYPYTKQMTDPAGTAGWMTIGSTSTGSQTQAGLDSKAHLAGKSLPIYGVAKAVSAESDPEVQMKHISSVVAVNLTNDTSSPLKVNAISFTAPDAIVGTFYVDITGEDLAFRGSGESYVSKTATLSVSGSETIAAGASAKFYIAIKPFAAKVGDELKLTVLADQGEVEKTLSLKQAYTFSSGKIKTLNLSYTAPVVIQTITVADINTAITSTDKSNPSEITGQLSNAVVSFVSGYNAFIQDETGGILLYLNGHGLEAGDVLSGVVTAKGYLYNGLKELIALSGHEKTAGTAPEAVSMTLADLLADYENYISMRVKVTGVTVSTGFSSRNTTMTDGDASLALRDQKNGLTITPGEYDITGYPGYFNGNQFGVWTQEDIVSSGTVVNIFDVSPQQISVTADATSCQINVTGNVDWTAEASEGATIDKTAGTGEAVINVSFPVNTDTEHVKEYTVFVRTEAEGVNDEFPVEITQAKADASGASTATVDFSAQGYENGSEMPATTKINGVTFAFDKGTNNNAPKYYNTGTAVRMYGSNTMTVSVDGKTIVSIVLGFGDGDGTNPITTDVPTYEAPTWTGEAASVTFAVGGTSGQRRIKTVTVKYKDGGSVPTPVDPTLTVEPASISVNVAETAKITVNTNSTGVVSFASNKTDIATVATDGTVTGVAPGTAKITVSVAATASYNAKSVDVPVEVTAPVSGGNTVSMTTAEYVAANGCTVSSGNDATMYKTLQLNESVRMSTTGADNCGSFWGTNREWRLYQNKDGNVIITVAEGCELKSVKLTFTVSNNGALLDSSNNTIQSGTAYSVSGTSVTYVVGNTNNQTNGQVKITAVEVVYTGEGTFATATLESITLSGQKTNYFVGDTYALDGKVIAHYSDGTEKDVTSFASPSRPDMSTPGTKTVTVSYTEGSVTKTATYDITVSAAASHAGTLADPFSVVDAITATKALGAGNTSEEFYYTKGIISQIPDNGVSTDHGNATYFISDDGGTTTQFKVYRGRFIGNINFTATDQIQVGDEVIIYGQLTYYKSTEPEPEIAAGNYIYSLKRGGSYLKALSASAEQTTVGADASTVKVNVYGNASWTATVTGGATINPASGTGIGDFTVSIPENTSTTENKTYTVTVSGTGVDAVTITITQSKKSGSSGTEKTDILNQAFTGVTGNSYTDFSGKTGESGAVYAGNCAGGNESIQLRSNNNNSGVITTATGGKVKKVKVVWNSNTAAGRTLNVYGKSSAYSSAADLYNTSTQGTLLGTIVCGTSTELTVTSDYEFIGFRSANAAMYLTEVQIVWE